MRIALRELRRRPGRFDVATAALAVLALLLLFLGGLLDGLTGGSTGAVRAQERDGFVLSASARDSFFRSRITPDVRARVEAVPGVSRVSGFGLTFGSAKIDGTDTDVGVAGYETGSSVLPVPPAPGEGYADERLEQAGVKVGDSVQLGQGTPIRVVGFVKDTRYLQNSLLWVNLGTWRSTTRQIRPESTVGDGIVQALTFDVASNSTIATVTAAIDVATGGATSTVSSDDAVNATPGVASQNSVFTLIIVTTLLVAALVVSLFFAFLTLERVPIYGVLKAIGSSSRQLFFGVLVQSLVVSVIAFAIGLAVVAPLAISAPSGLPFALSANRILITIAGLGSAAILGGLVSLRRVVNIDPAAAIGGGT